VEQAFQFFDSDGNGYIDGHELKALLSDKKMHPMQTKHFDEILQEVDEDGNGKIDVHEFMRMMSIRPPTKN